MKFKITTFLCCTFTLVMNLFSQSDISINVLEQDSRHTRIEICLDRVVFGEKLTTQQMMEKWLTLPEMTPLEKDDYPVLPQLNRLVQVPDLVNVSFQIIEHGINST